MEITVIQHTFLKSDQNKKAPEPQLKQKNPRSSEKNSGGNTACSCNDKAAKGGSQYLCFNLNENVSLLRHS